MQTRLEGLGEGQQPYLDNMDKRSRKESAGTLTVDQEVDRIYLQASPEVTVRHCTLSPPTSLHHEEPSGVPCHVDRCDLSRLPKYVQGVGPQCNGSSLADCSG